MLRSSFLLVFLPASLLSFQALAAPSGTTPPARSQPPSTTAPAAQPLSDAEILAMLEAMSNASIEQARSAHTRASDQHVKKFAHSVEKRNDSARQRQTKLGKHHNLQATGGKSVDDFRQSFNQNYRNIEGLASGAEFDRLYVDDEIASLTYVAETIDNKLLPNAHLKELRTELQTMRDEVKHELKKAHELRDRLNKTSK